MYYGFFIQTGIKASDAHALRRICIQMSAAGYGDVGYFIGLPIEELMEMVDEVIKIVQERRNKKKR